MRLWFIVECEVNGERAGQTALNGSEQEIRTVVNRDGLGCGKDSLVPLTR